MIKIILQTIILATAVFTFSCKSNVEKNNEPGIKPMAEIKQQQDTNIPTVKSDTSSTTSKILLDHFKGIPKGIDGCACYFSASDQKFKNKEYLFAAGFDSTGFVSVNNKLVKLKLVSTEKKPDSFGNYDHIDIYNSDSYKITVDIKYKKSSGDETWWNEGTVTIETKDGEKFVKTFVGECGC